MYYEYGEYDGKTVADWMVSHDMHYDGERYDSVDLEDKSSDHFMRGALNDDDSIEDAIDKSRTLASILVSRLASHEASACAVLFGKWTADKKNMSSKYFKTKDDVAVIKKRLSNLFDEFIYENPQLENKSFRSMFCRNVIDLCEKIYASEN